MGRGGRGFGVLANQIFLAPQQNLWVDSDELVTGNAWDRSVDAPWGSFG
jgi:hypothetical protein